MNFWTEIFIFLKLFFINGGRKIERKFKMIGIYKFENLINGHKYIGQSVDIERRYKDHIIRASKNFSSNPEYNSILHQAIRKYGIENFSFEIVEQCSKKDLDKKEIYWIQYYNSFHNGYNATSGGQNQESSLKFDEQLVKKIQNILLTTNISYNEIHNKFNISLGRISEINTGKIWYNPKLQYPLRSKKKIWYCKTCGIQVSQGQEYCFQCSSIQKRKVERPSRNELKNLIRSKTFVDIAKQFNVSDNAIKKWCDFYNLPRKKSDIKKYSDTEWSKI